MKRKFTFKTLLTVIVSCVSLATVQAQQSASATWTLATDPTATVTGPLSASEQMLGPLIVGTSYNTGYGTAANNNQTTGWQRVGTTSGLRSTSDSAFTQGSYIEYSVTPSAGNYLQVNTISAEIVGGGTGNARLAAMYSLDGFASMDSFGVTTSYNGVSRRATRTDSVVLINGGSSIPVLTGQQVVSFTNLAINVNPGQTFTVRFYVWLTGYSATIRHIGERNVVISGMTNTAPFPVSFASAKAFQKNNGVQVEWTSATETNVSKYVVERSKDGRSFTDAGTVTATGNSTITRSYRWFDATPVAGNNFYRIKAVDADGSVKYTGIMKVSLGKGRADIAISPNPVRGTKLNLQMNNLDKGTYSLNLYNSAGQRVFTRQVDHEGGSASQTLQLPAVKPGMYNFQVVNNTTRINKSIIIE